jgi:hypothetical protein
MEKNIPVLHVNNDGDDQVKATRVMGSSRNSKLTSSILLTYKRNGVRQHLIYTDTSSLKNNVLKASWYVPGRIGDFNQ